jgi:hypothetical protein
MDKVYYNYAPNSRYHPMMRHFGIKKNKNYCDEVDLYNLNNPDNVFGLMNFVTDYTPGGIETILNKEIFRYYSR